MYCGHKHACMQSGMDYALVCLVVKPKALTYSSSSKLTIQSVLLQRYPHNTRLWRPNVKAASMQLTLADDGPCNTHKQCSMLKQLADLSAPRSCFSCCALQHCQQSICNTSLDALLNASCAWTSFLQQAQPSYIFCQRIQRYHAFRHGW